MESRPLSYLPIINVIGMKLSCTKKKYYPSILGYTFFKMYILTSLKLEEFLQSKLSYHHFHHVAVMVKWKVNIQRQWWNKPFSPYLSYLFLCLIEHYINFKEHTFHKCCMPNVFIAQRKVLKRNHEHWQVWIKMKFRKAWLQVGKTTINVD